MNDSAKHMLEHLGQSMHHIEHHILDGIEHVGHDVAHRAHRSPKGHNKDKGPGWVGLKMALRIQRTFRKRHAKFDVPEDDLDNAAVCLFVLSPNFFQDERSLALITRAVELKKQCELIVMPGAKFGPERDKPFPENVFNPAWKPYLPKLGPAFRTIAINWEVEYKPACLQMAVERVAPLIRTKVDLGHARLRCTEMENDELAKAAAWKPKEMKLEWKWEEKVFDVFLSHKITDAKDIVLSWYNTLSAMEYKPFLDRLTLDKVENIPMYVEQTVTVAIAVSTNLFQSYWCAVELCKAVECHAQGKLNILLVPVQGDIWEDPSSKCRPCPRRGHVPPPPPPPLLAPRAVLHTRRKRSCACPARS